MNRKKPAKIICRGCENSFLTINNRLKYCSDDCKKVVHRKKYGKKPIKFGKCIFCRKGANTIINKKPLCKTCFYREKFKIIKGKNRSAKQKRYIKTIRKE